MAETGPVETGTVGSRIDGRYLVEKRLGRGGMAAVYRARDEALGRTVAVKLFDRDPASTDDLHREVSEVSLLASLNHHALVTLFDANIAVEAGVERAYFVMEYVDGSTLGERIARGPVSPADAAALACDLAEALHVVHSHGVVHRDVKPANVLLTKSPLPGREFRSKLADFGISYLIDSTRMTVAGTVLGTAAYLSPEQAQGQTPTAATDVYSLGLVLLETLTRKREFEGTMMEAVAARLARDPVVPDSLDPDWRELLVRMTRRDPASRPTALEVATAANRLVGSAGRPWQSIASAAGLATVAVAGSGDSAPTMAMPVPPPSVRRPDRSASGPAPAPDASGADEVPTVAVTAEVVPDAVPTASASDAMPTEAMTATPPAVTTGTPPAPPRTPPAASPPASPAAATVAMPSPPAVVGFPPTWSTPMGPPLVEPAAAVPQPDAPGRTRRIALVVVTVILVVAAIVVGALALGLAGPGSTSPDPAPTLPTVDDPLGSDLQQLMDEVTP